MAGSLASLLNRVTRDCRTASFLFACWHSIEFARSSPISDRSARSTEEADRALLAVMSRRSSSELATEAGCLARDGFGAARCGVRMVVAWFPVAHWILEYVLAPVFGSTHLKICALTRNGAAHKPTQNNNLIPKNCKTLSNTRASDRIFLNRFKRLIPASFVVTVGQTAAMGIHHQASTY